MSDFKLKGRSATFATGVLSNRLAISVWRGAPDTEGFGAQREAVATVVDVHPGKCGFLCVIEASSPKPSDEFSFRVSQMFREFDTKLGACAYVVEGPPMRSAFVRAIMTGMTLLKGTPQPMKFFGDVPAAAAWLQRRAPLGASVSAEQATEELRETIGTP